MALKDFDISKIKSWKYPTTSLPQTFQANGGIVTGARNKIEEQFIEADKINSKSGATKSDDYIGKIGTPQSYQVQNRAGTGIITGLQGIISDDLDELKSKSLIIKTYDEMIINEDGIFTSFNYRTENPTHGFRHIPIMLKDLGIGSLDAQPERFAPPQIGQHSSLTRGGIFTDAVTKDHVNILYGTDQHRGVMGKFLADQLLLQTEAISKGNSFGIPSPFGIFNVAEFGSNLVPGARVYRHGLVPNPFGRPANYKDNYPKIGEAFSLGGGKLNITAGALAGADLNIDNKLSILYDYFLLSDTKAGSGGGWFARNISDPLRNSLTSLFTDPYPIIPSQNVVGSPSLKEGMNQAYFLDNKENYEGYTEQGDYQLPVDGGGLLSQLTTGESAAKYSFFSKSKQTVFNLQQPAAKKGESAFANLKFFGDGEARPKIGDDKSLKDIPLSVGGIAPELGLQINPETGNKLATANNDALLNYSQRAGLNYSTLAYNALGADDTSNVIDAGGAASVRYEEALRSPSEINQTLATKFGGLGKARTDALIAESGLNGDKMITGHTGVRDHFKEKVYNIGRQGITSVNPVADTKKILYGAIHKGGSSNESYKTDLVDKVNMIPYGHNAGEDSFDAHSKAEALDFVPLVFYDVYNKKSIAFRAILDDITDTVTPDWDETGYIGRPIKSATYKGVSRKIGFTFEIFPKTKQEFPVLLEKVNYLVGQCYPNLDSNLRQTGPMIRLTLGDIMHKQLGYITECTVTFPKASPWEIDPGLRFTKHITVSIGFTHVGGYIPMATGKHYGLPWLTGNTLKWTKAGNANYDNYPNRTSSENTPHGAKNDYRELFQDLGQAD